jgi:uncharacterized membrane protein YfcA
VPLGTVLLSHLDPGILEFAIGGLLLSFSTYMFFGRSHATSAWGGLIADGTIGFVSEVKF